MAQKKKLWGDIELTLKKVNEGIQIFDDVWDKLHSASQANLKERFQSDLKTEIKKLQRLRDQIKTWQGMAEIRDKRIIDDARKNIEVKMEQFKACERDAKIKAYSKVGLAQPAREDPEEVAREASRHWLNQYISELSHQVETIEAEVEGGGGVKKKKGGRGGAVGGDTALRLQRHRFHIGKLEQLLRMLDNEQVGPEEVDTLKDSVKDYVERNEEADYDYETEAEGIYDEIAPHDVEEDFLEGVLAEHKQLKKEKEKEERHEVKHKRREEKPAPAAQPHPAPAAAAQPAGGAAAAAGRGSAAAQQPPSPLKARPPAAKAPQPTQNYAAVAKQAAGAKPAAKPAAPAKQGSSSVHAPPHPPAAASTPGSTPASTPTLTPAPAAAAPPPVAEPRPRPPSPGSSDHLDGADSAAGDSRQQHERPRPVVEVTNQMIHQAAAAAARQQAAASTQRQQPPRPAAPAAAATTAATAAAAPAAAAAAAAAAATQEPAGQQQSAVAAAVAARLRDPPTVDDTPEGRANMARMLAQSAANLPQPEDTQKRRPYIPPNPFKTPKYYPQQPHSVFEHPDIFAKFNVDTLFFIFYYQQSTYQQYLAAKELKRQSWRFHKKFQTWFQRADAPSLVADDHEQGAYVFFDYESGWAQRVRKDFTFKYCYLEDDLGPVS